QFVMYYFMIGIVLGVERGVEFFPLYLFSGIIWLNLFSEATRATTGSIVGNAALVKKIFFPRELFPVAAVGSALIHFLPQFALLVIVYFIFGWTFSWLALLYVVIAVAIMITFTLGLGLF